MQRFSSSAWNCVSQLQLVPIQRYHSPPLKGWSGCRQYTVTLVSKRRKIFQTCVKTKYKTKTFPAHVVWWSHSFGCCHHAFPKCSPNLKKKNHHFLHMLWGCCLELEDEGNCQQFRYSNQSSLATRSSLKYCIRCLKTVSPLKLH